MPVSLNTRAFGLLWNWSLESLVGLLTDSMEPHTCPWLISFLERTSESLWYSKYQPLIFPQGKLLSYSKTLFTMFSVLLAQFSQIIFCRSAFLSSFTLTRISKVHASWRLKQTQISKTFYKHYMRVASFDFGEIQTQKTTFLEVRSSLFLHHPVIENCLFQCAVKQPIKLMSWTIFFCANILQKEFNLLQMEQVDSWLHPSLVCERFLVLRCSLTSWLMASLTSPQIYKHILVLKEFSQTTCIILSVQEEGFPVWTSLPLFTVCQTPSVNSDMSNLSPTITHT